MKKVGVIGCGVLLILALILGVTAFSSYNGLVKLDEGVKSSWSQVQNAYQRRADLIPNLVRTMQGAANFERETLKEVIEALARASSIHGFSGKGLLPGHCRRREAAGGTVLIETDFLFTSSACDFHSTAHQTRGG